MKHTIRQLREERGWSREYVAVQVGVTFSTIANLESGRHLPRVDLAQKIARLFEASLDDIVWERREREKGGDNSERPVAADEG